MKHTTSHKVTRTLSTLLTLTLVAHIAGGGGGGVNLSPTAHAEYEYNETNNEWEWNDINALEPITAEDFNAVANKAAQAQDTATTADTKADNAQQAAETAQSTADAALPATDFTQATVEALGFSTADADTLGSLACSAGQVAKWNDVESKWECAEDTDTDTNRSDADIQALIDAGNFLTTETDPSVADGITTDEITDETITSQDILDGTITDADLAQEYATTSELTAAVDGVVIEETDPTVNAAAKADLSTCAAGDVLLLNTSMSWECSSEVSGAGQWNSEEGSNNIYYTEGNIGIATTNPQALLHIESSNRENSINRSCPAGTLWAGHIAGKASVDWDNDGRTDGNDYNILLGIDTNDYLEDNECVVFGTSTIGTTVDSGEFHIDTNLNRIVDEGEVITGANIGNLNVSGEKISCETGYLWLDQNLNGYSPDTGECIAPQYDENSNILRTDFTGETCPTGTQQLDENNDGNTDDGECHLPAFLANSNGNLGIGTTDPQQALHVNGGLMASSLLLEDHNNPTFQAKDFFAHSHSIGTEGAQDFEAFVIDGETYLAVANYYKDSDYTHNSYIYQWNSATSDFDVLQGIATEGARNFESFVIDGETYLAVANYRNDSSYNIDSKIYQWNTTTNQFDEVQAIATSGAADFESFVIDGETYLAVANYYNGSTRNRDSKIYQWNSTTSQFDEIQAIATNGAFDFESFVIDGQFYLAVANYYSDSTNILDSKIYKWNSSINQFEEEQSIATVGGRDFESFTIDGETYLAVANAQDQGLYNVDSKIYQWNGSEFIELQAILTNTAVDFESFVMDGETYLAVANYYDGSTHNKDSKIYQWNSATNQFDEMQAISTNGAYNFESFAINGETYLVVANYYDGSTYNINSHIYTYDSFLTLSITSTLAEDNPLFVFQNGTEELVTIENNGELQVPGNVEAGGFTINGVPLASSSDTYWTTGTSSGDIAYNAGNVGIGTSSPDGRLTVAINSNADGYEAQKWDSSVSGLGNESHALYGPTGDWYIRSASSDGKVILQDSGGNVGIGTNNPSAKLYVMRNNDDAGVATTKAELREKSVFTIAPDASVGTTNMNFGLVGGGDTVGIQTTNSSATADWNIALNPFGGNVGIGTTSPCTGLSGNNQSDCKLQVMGHIFSNGTSIGSDSRLKTAVTTIPSALEKILSLRGVTFEWKTKEFPERNFAQGTQIGLIAQEVEEVFPELVSQGEYKSVSYASLVSPLIEAAKELYTLYQGHADRLAALEAQNAEQDNHIAHQDERIAHQDELIVQLEVRLAALEAAQ